MAGGHRSGNMMGIGQHLAKQQNQQQAGYQAGNTNGVLRPQLDSRGSASSPVVQA